MTEQEEFEFRLRLESEARKPSQAAETGFRLGRALLRGGPVGLAAEGVGMGWEGLEDLAKRGAGPTVDAVAKVAPPEVAGAAGTAVEMAPTLIGGGVGSGAGKQTLEKGAKWLMQQAILPTSEALAKNQRGVSAAGQAIDTMLKEGIPATSAGAAMLREKIAALKNEVAARIVNSPAGVDRKHVYEQLSKQLDEVSAKGAGYKTDRAAVLKAWDDFKHHPLLDNIFPDEKISMQAADQIKRASQKAAEKAYSPLASPSTADDSQKAIARGLKRGMNEADPVVAGQNAKISEYVNALEVMEPRVAMQGNKGVVGITPAAASDAGTIAMLADRNPWIKSLLARWLYDSRNKVPFGVGAAAEEVHRTSGGYP